MKRIPIIVFVFLIIGILIIILNQHVKKNKNGPCRNDLPLNMERLDKVCLKIIPEIKTKKKNSQ